MGSIRPIAAFSDNYIWLYDDGAGRAFVVDPGDAAPVAAALAEAKLTLDTILVTHHHFDHTGGVAELKRDSGCRVVGPDNPDIEAIDEHVGDGDRVAALDLTFDVLAVPGHTLDHIAFYSDGPPPVLFCGDTLFAGGCGRLFEGTPAMMHASLQKLAALPAATAVYCAHEYTQANLAFASAAEPDNDALARRADEVRAHRERGLPTVPSRIDVELETNPFLRCDESGIRGGLAAAGREPAADAVGRFAQLRAWKDDF